MEVKCLSDDGSSKLSKIAVVCADITELKVDVIVNAANSPLKGGGGVDGAIHKKAGWGQLRDYNKKTHGECPTGSCVVSPGFKIPVNHIIHAVGPVGEKPELLAKCYRSCLTTLTGLNQRTVAFPCISTGIYGYPQRAAASVVLKTVNLWLDERSNFDAIDRVIFCTFLEEDYDIYRELIPQLVKANPSEGLSANPPAACEAAAGANAAMNGEND